MGSPILPQGLDRRPTGFGIAERLDQRRHCTTVVQIAERVGGRDPNPPVVVLEQAHGGRHDPGIIEGAGNHDRQASHVVVRIRHQFQDRLQQALAERLHGVQSPIPGPPGKRLREHQVALDDLPTVLHAQQYLDDG